MFAVIKADGYGHGSLMCAPTLLACGVSQFGVASIDEGIELRENKIKEPILVLGASPFWAMENAIKYDISVSLVHSAYTSQTCPKCGCIDSENRKSQEEFECIECGYKQNADINASENILKRVVSTVLRNELLKNSKLGNGTFEPKKLKREKVKEVLLSFRYDYNNSKNLEKST